MPKTNAERQAEYRRRNTRAGIDQDVSDRPVTARINTVVDYPAYTALTRLAAYHGLTRRAMLERLLADAQADLTADPATAHRYYAVTP